MLVLLFLSLALAKVNLFEAWIYLLMGWYIYTTDFVFLDSSVAKVIDSLAKLVELRLTLSFESRISVGRFYHLIRKRALQIVLQVH